MLEPTDTINDFLGLDLVITVNEQEAKGIRPSDDGGRCKLYLGKEDCLALAEAFTELSNRLKSK